MGRAPSLAWRVTCTLLFICAVGLALVLCVPVALTLVFHDFDPSGESMIDAIVSFVAATVLAIGCYLMLLNAWFAPRYLLSAWGMILAGELIGLLAGLHYRVRGNWSMVLLFAFFLPPLILLYVLQPRGTQKDSSARL